MQQLLDWLNGDSQMGFQEGEFVIVLASSLARIVLSSRWQFDRRCLNTTRHQHELKLKRRKAIETGRVQHFDYNDPNLAFINQCKDKTSGERLGMDVDHEDPLPLYSP